MFLSKRLLEIISDIIQSYGDSGLLLEDITHFLGGKSAAFWWYDHIADKFFLENYYNRPEFDKIDHQIGIDRTLSTIMENFKKTDNDYLHKEVDDSEFRAFKVSQIPTDTLNRNRFMYVIAIKNNTQLYGFIVFHSNSFNQRSIAHDDINLFSKIISSVIYNHKKQNNEIWQERWKIGHELARTMSLTQNDIKELINRSDKRHIINLSTFQKRLKKLDSSIQTARDSLKYGTLTEGIRNRIEFAKYVELQSYTENIVKTSKTDYSHKNLSFYFRFLKMHMVKVKIHPSDADLLISNIISNMYKYTPKNGQFEIEEYLDSSRYTLKFTNDSEHLSKTEIERIWRFGLRARNSKTIEGQGIGLSVIDDICSSYGIYKDIFQYNESTVNRVSVVLSVPLRITKIVPV